MTDQRNTANRSSGAKRTPPVTVALLWHSLNSDNLGIGALTASQIAIIDELALSIGLTVRYKVIGWRNSGEPFMTRADVAAVPLRARDLIRPDGLYAVLRSSDLVLDISAGDSFADIYGTRRFLFNLISKIVAVLSGRPIFLAPQTIGPFQRWWARHTANLFMCAVRRVVTRDAISSDYLRSLGLGHKATEATDVAFRLPYDAPGPRTVSHVRVGINVSGLLFNGGYTTDNMFSLVVDYPALARELVSHFTTLAECEVHLIGHVNSLTHEVEDDYRVAQRLASEFPETIVGPRFETPSDAKSYIAAMDFFCGSRMHACIAAFSSGVPVLPIAYSRKFAGLFGTLGYNRIGDCKSQSADEILRTVVDAFEHRESLKKEVEACRKLAETKLASYERILRDCLQNLK